jgi:predicted CopG family antitoxin
MAVKTITIDMDAYEALRRHKREGQSFSKVIKEHFSGGPTGRVLKRSLVELKLSESTLEAVDCVIAERSKDSPRVPTL